MNYKELIDLAIGALRANILRTSLTMLGIVIGISSVILIVSVGQGAVAFVTNELSSFGSNVFQVSPGEGSFSNFTGADTVTLADVNLIKNDTSLTNIEYVIPAAISSVNVTANDESKNIIIQGVTSDMVHVLQPTIVQGDFLSEENDIDNDRVVVLGINTAEYFFGENTDVVGESIKIDNKTFRIIGVLRSDNAIAGSILNNVIVMPINIVMKQLPGGDRIQRVSIKVYDVNKMNQTIQDVEALLRDSHNLKEDEKSDFAITSFQDILSTVRIITNLLTLMVAGISAISLVVGGVGVMNIMLVSVTERTKEVGLLKSIGAKEKDILTQFLIEAMVMTFSGGVIGVIIGITGAFIITFIVGIPFTLNIPAILIAVGRLYIGWINFWFISRQKSCTPKPNRCLKIRVISKKVLLFHFNFLHFV